MKTAGRENPNRWVAIPNNRAHGAERQNRSCSNNWAAKQEKVQPLELCFFLTFPFIEQTSFRYGGLTYRVFASQYQAQLECEELASST
jgi:hypothetical protein